MTGEYARPVPAVFAAWLLSLGVDLFLHAGLLARIYATPSPFLLAPEDAFRRIPAGYAAFLVLTSALYWFLRRLDARGARRGWRVGLTAGLVVWGALALGLYSISTARPLLLLGWWLGQAVELGLAGAVIAAMADGLPAGKAIRRVIAVVILLFGITVLLQTLGLAPAMKRVA